jgi:hypothetical protein
MALNMVHGDPQAWVHERECWILYDMCPRPPGAAKWP